jgi:hypothetical protein
MSHPFMSISRLLQLLHAPSIYLVSCKVSLLVDEGDFGYFSAHDVSFTFLVGIFRRQPVPAPCFPMHAPFWSASCP